MFSLRMRASKTRKHISGAERIIHKKDVPEATKQLTRRAMFHENGMPDTIHITIEKIYDKIQKIPALPLTTITARNHEEAKRIAIAALKCSNIPETLINNSFKLLQEGPAPDRSNMRGAIIMDCESGQRLEPDNCRGVRATRMDMSEKTLTCLRENLASIGLDDRINVIKEALVLASKVANFKTVAELCISDDPSNNTGYVASNTLGFIRIPQLKETKTPTGGRIFFVEPTICLGEYINYLEHTPLIIDGAGRIRETTTSEFLKEVNSSGQQKV